MYDKTRALLGDREAAKRRIEEAQAQNSLAWNSRAPEVSP